MPLPPLRRMVGDEAFEELWRLRLEETPPWPFEWLRHQRRDDYWRHGSLCEDWASIEVPVLSIGGWQDGYRDACLALLAHGALAAARDHRAVGPRPPAPRLAGAGVRPPRRSSRAGSPAG